jgi:hypothetical protein
MYTPELMEPLIIGVLTTLLGVLVGYLTGYANKKGENRAIHEDIGKLTDQVAAVTKTAKEIEAKISSDLWDRQKRWELKREVLFEVTRKTAQIEDAIRGLSITLDSERKDTRAGDLDWMSRKNEALKAWIRASNEFDETKLLVTIVCGMETGLAIHQLGAVVVNMAADLVKGEDAYTKAMDDFNQKLFVALKAIRKELGIDALDQPLPVKSA